MGSRVEGVNKTDNKRKFITSETKDGKELLHVTLEQGQTSNTVSVSDGTLDSVDTITNPVTVTGITDVNTKLDTLHGDLDGVETKLDTLHTDNQSMGVTLNEINQELNFKFNSLMRPIWYNMATNSLLVSFPAAQATTISSGTVTTLTSMTQKGGIPLADTEIRWEMDSRWQMAIRNRIS